VRAVVFQQLAGRAAQAIFGRLRAAVGGLTPEAFNAVSDADLRAAGLSANKLASLRDLSAKVLDGTVVLTRTSRRSDDELIARLTAVRGIGRWTARRAAVGAGVDRLRWRCPRRFRRRRGGGARDDEVPRPHERIARYGAHCRDCDAHERDRVEAGHERVVRGVHQLVSVCGRHRLQGTPGPA
jgi:hypothetical protein